MKKTNSSCYVTKLVIPPKKPPQLLTKEPRMTHLRDNKIMKGPECLENLAHVLYTIIVIWDKIYIHWFAAVFWNIKSHHLLLPVVDTRSLMTSQFKAFKSKKSVLQTLLSCQCNDFVAVQLINVEVIQVSVASVVIIENTLSKKARYQMFYHLLVFCW